MNVNDLFKPARKKFAGKLPGKRQVIALTCTLCGDEKNHYPGIELLPGEVKARQKGHVCQPCKLNPNRKKEKEEWEEANLKAFSTALGIATRNSTTKRKGPVHVGSLFGETVSTTVAINDLFTTPAAKKKVSTKSTAGKGGGPVAKRPSTKSTKVNINNLF